jgi:hypothetical protein
MFNNFHLSQSENLQYYLGGQNMETSFDTFPKSFFSSSSKYKRRSYFLQTVSFYQGEKPTEFFLLKYLVSKRQATKKHSQENFTNVLLITLTPTTYHRGSSYSPLGRSEERNSLERPSAGSYD